MKHYASTGQPGKDVSAFFRDGKLIGHVHDYDSDYGNPAFNLNTAYPGQVVSGSNVTVVNDPILGAARKVLRMQVPEVETEVGKVRTQLVERFWHMGGEEFWYGFGVLFPVGFATVPSGGWFMFNETHGPPFNGASYNCFIIRPVDDYLGFPDYIGFGGGNSDKFMTPMQRGAWIDFAVHLRLSRSAHHGFAEVWMNKGSGWTQLRGRTGDLRAHYTTISPSNTNGFLGSMMKHYRKSGMAGWGTQTQYFAEHRIGESLEAVKPHSYA